MELTQLNGNWYTYNQFSMDEININDLSQWKKKEPKHNLKF